MADETHTHTDVETRETFRVYQIAYYILWIIEVLLLVRFIFRLLGANPANGFVDFLYTITAPLIAPFVGIFESPAIEEAAFETATLVAMLIYAIVVYAIIKLISIITATSEEERP